MDTVSSESVAVLTTLYKGDNLGQFSLALDSLLHQTYAGDKIRIYLYVDGPITLEQQEFLRSNNACFYNIVYAESNQGLAFGLNRLLEIVEDEKYVLRMDMDDIAHPDRVRRQVEFMNRSPDISLCGCNSIEIDFQGKQVFQRDYPECSDEIRASLVRGNPILHPAYCLRSSAIRQHSLRYRSIRRNQDLAFLFDFFKKGLKAYNLQERLISWRTSEDFIKRRNLKSSMYELSIYIRGIYTLNGLSPKLAYPCIRFVFRCLPNNVAKFAYRSDYRNLFLKGW